jgi:protein-disulfide isomerase
MKSESSSGAASKLMLSRAKLDHIQGPIDAPISLVEFGDYECPYCGEAYPIIKAIQKKLGKRLCFAFRNFPLSNMHPHAEHAAEAAEAAAAQGKFWEMHDMLYENQSALEDDDIAGYATDLSLDANKIFAEIQAGTYTAHVRDDFKAGVHAGVNGTPTFFINGVRYDGMKSFEELYAALAGS